MKRLTFYLLALGILPWVPLLGEFIMPAHGGITGHPSLLRLCLGLVYSAVSLWLAWGIYNRIRVAWHVGLIGLAMVWLWTIVEICSMFAKDHQLQSPGAKIGFAALVIVSFSLLYLYWGRRWYRQRSYFSEPHTGGSTEL
jgi:hypothetical protein